MHKGGKKAEKTRKIKKNRKKRQRFSRTINVWLSVGWNLSLERYLFAGKVICWNRWTGFSLLFFLNTFYRKVTPDMPWKPCSYSSRFHLFGQYHSAPLPRVVFTVTFVPQRAAPIVCSYCSPRFYDGTILHPVERCFYSRLNCAISFFPVWLFSTLPQLRIKRVSVATVNEVLKSLARNR